MNRTATTSSSTGCRSIDRRWGRLLDVHHIHVISAAAIGDERQPLAVRRPGSIVVLARMPGQVALAGAVGVHDIDLVIAVAVGSEGDALAVRRPDGPVIHLRV